MTVEKTEGFWNWSAKILKNPLFFGRYDIQHNDTQHNDTQHNDTEHNNTQHNDTQHNDIQHDIK